MGQSMHDKRRGLRRNKADNQTGQGMLRELAEKKASAGKVEELAGKAQQTSAKIQKTDVVDMSSDAQPQG